MGSCLVGVPGQGPRARGGRPGRELPRPRPGLIVLVADVPPLRHPMELLRRSRVGFQAEPRLSRNGPSSYSSRAVLFSDPVAGVVVRDTMLLDDRRRMDVSADDRLAVMLLGVQHQRVFKVADELHGRFHFAFDRGGDRNSRQSVAPTQPIDLLVSPADRIIKERTKYGDPTGLLLDLVETCRRGSPGCDVPRGSDG